MIDRVFFLFGVFVVLTFFPECRFLLFFIFVEEGGHFDLSKLQCTTFDVGMKAMLAHSGWSFRAMDGGSGDVFGELFAHEGSLHGVFALQEWWHMFGSPGTIFGRHNIILLSRFKRLLFVGVDGPRNRTC